MKKWMFVSAVVTVAGFMVETAAAQEPVKAPSTVITTPSTPVLRSVPFTTNSRPGLLGRLRARRGTSSSSTIVTPSSPIVTPPTRSSALPMPTTTTPVTGTTPSTTVPSPIQQAGLTTTTPVTMTPTVVYANEMVQGRQGLLARMRSRR